MIVKLGFLVAASVAVYAVKQLNLKTQRSSSGNIGAHSWDEEEEKEQITCSMNGLKEGREEEVKLINGICNPTLRKPPNIEEDPFLQFEHLLSRKMDFPFKHCNMHGAENAEKDQNEIKQLRNLVKELEEREEKLEAELLEYYGLKEQEASVLELQKQLEVKSVEIDMLNITINTLQGEKKRLQEEVSKSALARKELEEARNKLKEMQRQIQIDANRTKAQLLLLKQQVSVLQAEEEEAMKADSGMEKMAKHLKELEVEVIELKRKNKELQIEKRELAMKLDAAEAKKKSLPDMKEGEVVSSVREEVAELRHTNEDLQKQVEGLQMNRFNEVEELVYLRWLNACLRYELRNHQTPTGQISACDLNRSLSPKSQERAKQLLLDYETSFSWSSSPGSEEFDTTTAIPTTASIESSTSKKPSLIQKLKKWGRSKDKVHRAPEVAEYYQTLIKREWKKESSPPLVSSTSSMSDGKSNRTREMEKESSFRLTADERAVSKHFDWSEGKSDALREATFEHDELLKLENQVSAFVDDPNLSWEAALKKMYELLEKVEGSVYPLLHVRDAMILRYGDLGIPTDWLLDSGVLGKIKRSLVQLACMYMKRVALALDALSGHDKEPLAEFLILQGVRFAFRVHQFAGGFDAESMKAFEELRSRAHTQTGEMKQED